MYLVRHPLLALSCFLQTDCNALVGRDVGLMCLGPSYEAAFCQLYDPPDHWHLALDGPDLLQQGNGWGLACCSA